MSDITVPIDGLNDAWMAAQPGDRLFMEPGDHAPVQLASRGGGAPGAPVWIIGSGARIVATGRGFGLNCRGGHDVVVDGLTVDGGVNGIQFSQSGADFTAICANIKVQNCVIANCDDDGVKVSQCDDARVLGCLIANCGEQCIDFLDVDGGEITANDCSGASVAAGICVKGGSRAIPIQFNTVHDLTVFNVAGIQAGGYTDPQYVRPEHRDAEAHGLSIGDNTVLRVAGQAINFLGACSCSASLNTLESLVLDDPGGDHSWHAVGIAPNFQGLLSTYITVKFNTYLTDKAHVGLDSRQDIERDHLTIMD